MKKISKNKYADMLISTLDLVLNDEKFHGKSLNHNLQYLNWLLTDALNLVKK